jgi:hypothetical protein
MPEVVQLPDITRVHQHHPRDEPIGCADSNLVVASSLLMSRDRCNDR